ncbi:biotin--[acetyl-CoA-carboxylase] ligase [Helicobacter sp. MIT 05-5294]|uniref:biotin--[acetyl-CoA-carboxylase] ligase n=1 Tax=Helicobacter sp. MIT 05-5294 TaxID=1548150 RepID=UPI0010FD49E5|nr:biotin--[acetyl-CoA-carboxylase] ligase [Helicobacter sp. MIT 05-5294]TLD85910.1 biotin--[acetyl-CoA-carboxylase] ligase [Helicobacter sp. MIT 05-5294]
MEILEFDCIESTQLFLAEKIRKEELKAPIMVIAQKQSGGIGSRGNVWENVQEGLYFSFALDSNALPQDLPLESVSIYFGFLFKEVLREFGSKIWLKYPNDLYKDCQKVGGIICTKIKETMVCGIGLNLKNDNQEFGSLDIQVSKEEIVDSFIQSLENNKKKLSWKQIFSKYSLEFPNNFQFTFHHNGRLISLRDSTLCEDGSILVEGERFYSLR